MRNFILTLSLFLICISGFSQSGYKIDFTIDGLSNSTIYLGYYMIDKTLVKDTTQVDSMGKFTFDGNTTLGHGVYFLVLPEGRSLSRMFDFVIGDDQFFSMATSKEDPIKSMKVTGDVDNQLFFENMLFNMERNTEVAPYASILQDSTLQASQKTEAQQEFQKVNAKVLSYQNDIITRHPTSMTARLLNANRKPDVPEPPRMDDGSIDSTFQFRYYRAHYFDNFDLGDDALLRLPLQSSRPLYVQKVDEYLDNLFVQQVDTLIQAIDGMIVRAKKSPEMYKYLVWNCVGKYQDPEIMGLDGILVHLNDKYFVTGEMDFWADATTRQMVADYAEKLRGSLVGKTAPNLIMQDQNLQPRSMYDIKSKYTILFIFRPTCSHCRQETPKLVQFYNDNKERFNLEVFAVDSDTSMQEMRDFIKEMNTPWITVSGPRSYSQEHYSKLYHAETTPTVYIIDDKKKIIAKKPPVDQIENFLVNYEKTHPN